jgi:hypothetical protein
VKDENSIPVTFKGENYIWLKNDDGSGALAYPQHVDQDGNVKMEHAFSDSFAHVMSDGAIMRYRTQIGTRDELVFGEASAVSGDRTDADADSVAR